MATGCLLPDCGPNRNVSLVWGDILELQHREAQRQKTEAQGILDNASEIRVLKIWMILAALPKLNGP